MTFRKIGLFYFLIFSCCINATSQSRFIQFGIEAGPNYTLLTGNHFLPDIYQPDIGYTAGLSVEYYFSEQISLRTGLSYERKSNQSDLLITNSIGAPIATGSSIYHMDFIALPILARVRFGESQNMFVNSGPYLAYFWRIHEDFKIDSGDPPFVDGAFGTPSKRMDAGVSIGLGIDLNLSRKLLLYLETRANIGLSNLNAPVRQFNLRANSMFLVCGFAFRHYHDKF